MGKSSTIYDVAAKAGVSAATVSRVVNNRPGVNKATKARVQKILDECHYVPNETARSLVKESSKMIGILISDIRTTHHTDAIYYIERALTERGYYCLIFNTGIEERAMAQNIQILGKRNVDAAILIGSIYQNDLVREAIETYLSQVPVILLNGYLDSPNIYGIVADEEEGVNNCVRYLAKKGRRNPVYVYDFDTPSGRHKLRGFEKGMEEHYGKKNPSFFKTNGNYDSAYNTVKDIVDHYPDTDAIIFSDDKLALIGVRCLTDLKIDMPGRMAIVGINNSQYAQICIPSLTSLDNMIYDLSLIAVRNLMALMSGERVNRRMMIYSEIVEREST